MKGEHVRNIVTIVCTYVCTLCPPHVTLRHATAGVALSDTLPSTRRVTVKQTKIDFLNLHFAYYFI